MRDEAKKENRKISIKGLFGKILKNKIGRIICLVLVAMIVLTVVLICSYEPKQTLDTTYIIAKLEKSSELTTAKLNYTGMSEFKDSGIAFINKSDFIMVYEAQARAGIDVKNINVVADDINHIVWLTLPKAEILDVKVDMNTIKYFDEDFSLFNVDAKEDANKANALAEEEAKKELAGMGILEMANDQAEALIKGLIQDVVPKDYEIKIKK